MKPGPNCSGKGGRPAKVGSATTWWRPRRASRQAVHWRRMPFAPARILWVQVAGLQPLADAGAHPARVALHETAEHFARLGHEQLLLSPPGGLPASERNRLDTKAGCPQRRVDGLVDRRVHFDVALRRIEQQPPDRLRYVAGGGEALLHQCHSGGDGIHTAPEDPDRVETGCQRPHALEGQPAIGRLQSDDAAAGGRDPDRATRVRAERHVSLPRGDAHGRSGRRPPRHPAGISRIRRRPEPGVDPARAERQLVQVHLADKSTPGAADGRHDRRVPPGDHGALGHGPATGRGDRTGDVDQNPSRRHAGHRPPAVAIARST